jgi:hypothetical protein
MESFSHLLSIVHVNTVCEQLLAEFISMFKISADKSVNGPINWYSEGDRNEKPIFGAFTGPADKSV